MTGEIIAIVKIENLPLYAEMAEFIITLAQGEDKQVPAYIQQHAYEIASELERRLEASNAVAS